MTSTSPAAPSGRPPAVSMGTELPSFIVMVTSPLPCCHANCCKKKIFLNKIQCSYSACIGKYTCMGDNEKIDDSPQQKRPLHRPPTLPPEHPLEAASLEKAGLLSVHLLLHQKKGPEMLLEASQPLRLRLSSPRTRFASPCRWGKAAGGHPVAS